jgi:hypothetical protein
MPAPAYIPDTATITKAQLTAALETMIITANVTDINGEPLSATVKEYLTGQVYGKAAYPGALAEDLFAAAYGTATAPKYAQQEV